MLATSTNSMSRPPNVGISAIEVYFPKKYVEQAELEQFDGISAGKYTIGLGQQRMSFCQDREDINSICLTVVKSLLTKYDIHPENIGRLEVGTETLIDKSKSVKSALMQLFQDSGNTDIEGIDTTNACYGGTNALINTINWVESSSWDGRLGLVVAADIAVYAPGPARPTGGCGAVAMLIGPDAPLVFDRGVRASHMEHVYDFYKPTLNLEYPLVDGALSLKCYMRALTTCYERYLTKLSAASLVDRPSLKSLDYLLLHSPFTKQVVKGVARLAFVDFLRNPMHEEYSTLLAFKNVQPSTATNDRQVQDAFVNFTKPYFAKHVKPSLLASEQIGNTYTASLWFSLATLISEIPSADLQNKRVGLFSYGSGLASTMFSLKINGNTETMAKHINLRARLDQRSKASPEFFTEAMAHRERNYGSKNFSPADEGNVNENDFFKDTYYVANMDDMYRKTYAVAGSNSPQ